MTVLVVVLALAVLTGAGWLVWRGGYPTRRGTAYHRRGVTTTVAARPVPVPASSRPVSPAAAARLGVQLTHPVPLAEQDTGPLPAVGRHRREDAHVDSVTATSILRAVRAEDADRPAIPRASAQAVRAAGRTP